MVAIRGGRRETGGPTARRRSPTGLRWHLSGVLLMAIMIVLSCTSGVRFDHSPVVPTDGIELSASDRAIEQRASLGYLFYRNNELPPTPDARELHRLDRDLAEAPAVEVGELRHLFGSDLELLAYATRDSDGDGVLDFRISEYRGKFFEGDIDLDGDGIRNVFDAGPYDPTRGGRDTDGDGIPDDPGSFADRDGDGIPDHLDWSRRKADPLPSLQAGLFHDFGLILVERSARFSPELVHSVDDVMRLVFREPIPTLRTLAVEDQLLISPDLGDNGYMVGQTQTLTVYDSSLEGADPLVLFGLVIHEVAHAWQLAQDFDEAQLLAENRKMHFPPGAFTSSLERYGWRVERHSTGEGYVHALYWPHFYATSPRFSYRGSSSAEWTEWFGELERDDRDFLRSSSVVSRGMVGPYALTSPWEWHADHLMAAVYNRMDQRLATYADGPMATSAALLRARMLGSVQRQWSRYDYRNALGTPVDREFAGTFPLTDDELDELVGRYVVPLADFLLLSDLTLDEVEEIGLDRVARAWEGFGHQAEVLYETDLAPMVTGLIHAGLARRPFQGQGQGTGADGAAADDSGDDSGIGPDENGAAGPEDEGGLSPAQAALEDLGQQLDLLLGQRFETRKAEHGARHRSAGRVGGLPETRPPTEAADLDDEVEGERESEPEGDPSLEPESPELSASGESGPELTSVDDPSSAQPDTSDDPARPVVARFEALRHAGAETDPSIDDSGAVCETDDSGAVCETDEP